MGIPVLIIGKSGTGKSRSMKNCVGKDFGLIRVLNKPLPFRGKIKGAVTNDYKNICASLASPKMAQVNRGRRCRLSDYRPVYGRSQFNRKGECGIYALQRYGR